MIEPMVVIDNEKYFENLKLRIELSNMWNSLQNKFEFGLNKSEKGYQELARIMAKNISRGLDLNVNLAEILTMCIGSFFPSYGNKGKKIILEYMNEKQIEMSESDLAINYIEYDLYSSGNIISIDFDKYLKELFDDNAYTDEVKVARFCNNIINLIKQMEIHSTIKSDKLYEITQKIERECISKKSLEKNDGIKQLEETINKKDVEEIPLVIKKKIYKKLDAFIKYNNNNLNGICEYIGLNEV